MNPNRVEEYGVREQYEGWISPDGELYLCEIQGHERLAAKLLKESPVAEERLFAAGDVLEDKGWVKLSYRGSGFCSDELTQKQIDCLFDLKLMAYNKLSPDLQSSIDQLFTPPSQEELSEQESPLEPQPQLLQPNKVGEYGAHEQWEGWISPDGDLYLCRIGDHEKIALRLLEMPIMTPALGSAYGDTLIDRGWVKLYYTSLYYEKDLTQKQIDTLFDLMLQSYEVFTPGLQLSFDEIFPAPVSSREKPIVAQEEDQEEPSPVRDLETKKKDRLEDHPTRTLTVRAYRGMGEPDENGSCHGVSTFKTFVTDVYDDDNNRIGSIGGGLGFVSIVYQGKEWLIKYRDLWEAMEKWEKDEDG